LWGREQREDKRLRIIDANLNRAEEGLRVVEDIIRFFAEDESLVKQIKDVRHMIADCARKHFSTPSLILSRTTEDVGQRIHAEGESRRCTIQQIVHANLKRVQQALRVLEEVSKIDGGGWKDFKSIRYKVYALEKEILHYFERGSSLCDSGL
jgi:thiamine-phosphate pyrophosphorylase